MCPNIGVVFIDKVSFTDKNTTCKKVLTIDGWVLFLIHLSNLAFECEVCLEKMCSLQL